MSHLAAFALVLSTASGAHAACFISARSPAAPDDGAPAAGTVRIVITTNSGQFRQGDLIRITVTNHDGGTLAYDEGPGCAPRFERFEDGAWRAVLVSQAEDSRAPCDRVTLAAGEARRLDRRIDRRPAPGTYRVRLQHADGVAFSPEFRIGD